MNRRHFLRSMAAAPLAAAPGGVSKTWSQGAPPAVVGAGPQRVLLAERRWIGQAYFLADARQALCQGQAIRSDSGRRRKRRLAFRR